MAKEAGQVYIEEKSVVGEHCTFTLKNTNVSIANAIRRTILEDIPTIGFKTFPHNENQATFHKKYKPSK